MPFRDVSWLECIESEKVHTCKSLGLEFKHKSAGFFLCVCLRQPLCRRHCRVCLFFRLSKYDFLKTTCVFCKKEEGKRSFLKIVAGNRMSRSVLDSFCPAHSCVSCLACYLFFLLQLHKGNYYCSVFRIYPFCGRRRMLSVMLRESSNSLSLSLYLFYSRIESFEEVIPALYSIPFEPNVREHTSSFRSVVS